MRCLLDERYCSMPTLKIVYLLGLCPFLFSPFAIGAGAVADTKIDIPYKKFVLTNGLTLIVHEDRKAPIVAVKVWYHVGSKNEKPGKTGFAHLFEHLLFTGSEHLKGSGDQRAFFEAMERIGATDMNGTTNPDRTDYFENVPVNALDVALWIESDRMGHFLGSIDQARLDVQRGVVQNEKRQGENQPYGLAWELITKGTAPPEHPYSWTVIGSMEDLNAASLEDVRTWFKTYYGAANTILALAGDIDPETARKKVEKYFGDIPAGPPVARHQHWVPRMTGTRRQKLADRVPQARIHKVWAIPAYGEAENVYLQLARDILAVGKPSRLYKRLVYDEQTATDVWSDVAAREISGLFILLATARPGEDLGRIERGLNEEIARFLEKGPTPEELERAKAERIAGFVRSSERIGGFGGKADVLAMNQGFRGDAGFYQTILKYIRNASLKDVRDAARKWLTDDVYVLEIEPYPEYGTNSSGADRSKLPSAGDAPEIKFPALQRATLPNGLKLVLAERHATPLVNVTLQIDAGFASDQFAIPGTARLATDMLDEGTARRTALDISKELGLLGAELSTDADLDSSTVRLSSLTSTLDRALEIFADVVLNPSFPQDDFERLQKQRIAWIKQEKVEPADMALRVFPAILYGRGHAYGNPLTGSGTEESVAKLTRADTQKFHQTWFKPNNSTLIIVGDTTLREMTPKLEKLLGKWQRGEVPRKNLAAVEHQKKTSVYLIDRPGSIQSVILAGHIAPPKSNPAEIAIETMNTVLGGAFTARVNMNLREGKHWSYGAWTFMYAARGQRPFIAYAPVQTDKTRESLVELNKELRGIRGEQPITEEELKKAQAFQTRALPGSWETISAVANSIGEIVRFDLPDDYYATYPKKVHALAISDLAKAANDVVRPDNLVWVVVGDRAKIETEIRDLGWGDIQLLDADGNRPTAAEQPRR